MLRVVRPLAVFSVASAVSVAAAIQLVVGVGGAHGSDGSAVYGVTSIFGSYEHELTRLRLLDKTLYHVEESYVEPGRLDWEAMYVEALDAVERKVPSTMFSREPGGSILSVEIGEYRTVLEVDPISSRRQLSEELKKVAALLDEHLVVDDIPVVDPSNDPFAEVEYTMINGLLSTLDPHSVLLPPPDATEMDVENQGEFGGLGITIVERKNRLTIEYPLPDTPAMRSGLQPDDRIVRIDGESTINMSLDEAVHLLRGPIGAPVVIEVERANEREPVEFTIVREKIKLNPVRGELLEGDIGYVQIKSFHQHVERDLHDTLDRLHRDTVGGELRGLVLDLRENPGGYLNQAVRVADTFLEQGTIVSTVDGTGQKRDEEVAESNGTEPRYPIAVLVDASSASASEIVAGALRNNERAVIIGERTFGKGSVQNLHNLVDESKLKITISKYLTPGDYSIQSVGIPADIELRSALVEKGTGDPEAETGPVEDVALVFYRERVRREVDLDHHLDRVSFRTEQPAYVVPYLRPWERRRRAPEPTKDFEVGLARDVLLAAPGWRRGEILASAGSVVQKASQGGEGDIAGAFERLGVDWSPGAPWSGEGPASASADGATEEARSDADLDTPVSLRFDLGEDGVLTAGEEERIALELTNTTDRPLYRVAAVAIDNEVIEGKEFFFGKLEPGETRRWEHTITLTDGYPSERMPVSFEVRDGSGETIATRHTRLPVAGRPLPRLEWSWTLSDVVGGDGDGIAEVGEAIELALTVRNVGNGPTADAFGRIKNKSRRALDIVRGNVAPGRVVDTAGEACAPEEPGNDAGTIVGDADHPRVKAGREPLWPEDCSRVLEPGQTWTGSFVVELKEEPPDGEYVLELGVGDQEAYDYASVMRAGFYSYFSQQEDVVFSPGVPLPEGPPRKPPVIQITRAPALVVDGVRATVSGVVEDDSGIAHVMVFSRGDKVFYQGSGSSSSVRSVPFTADVELEPGANTISVLSTDVDGFTHTSSVVTWYGDPELAKHEPAE